MSFLMIDLLTGLRTVDRQLRAFDTGNNHAKRIHRS
jgi:hypothetical protein